jgi:hypothetical protein
MKDTLSVTLPLQVKLKDIASLLVNAFEGGSNYWYEIKSYRKPKTFTFKLDDLELGAYPHCDYPLNKGGGVRVGIKDENGLEDPKTKKPVMLNLAKVTKGLQVMAKKYPHHFANFMADNADAETGDVFLQCCLYGEIIYG